ncbi:adenosylhomocysteinase [Saccharopolyspora sp. NPDC050389]|uniref:adenosylhomocysteinase n=1 Tax=Saccharopolyspora sp. NPDC050389 TaxID=3155516 RepID=UPI0033CD9C54
MDHHDTVTVPDSGGVAGEMAWIQRNSPLLDSYVRELVGDGSFQGLRVAVALHLDPKTGFLATVLQDAGAEVVVGGSNPRTTRDDVVEHLRRHGIETVGRRGEPVEDWRAGLLAIGDSEPDLILDDGVELVVLMAEHQPEKLAKVRGICEKTTTGTVRMRELAAAGTVRLPPSLTVDEARCKHLFDNRHSTGQTTLLAISRLTGMLLSGKRIAILGYGWVGRGLAIYARALGAAVSVIEIDPVSALEAHMDGMAVGDHATCLPGADLVITATGVEHVLEGADFDLLDDGVVLANAGHSDFEIDLPGLVAAGAVGEPVSEHLTCYRLGAKRINVLCEGALVNISGGAGNQIEVIDLTFAVQALGARLLARGEIPPGVHSLPPEVDDAIARARLASLGISMPGDVEAVTVR